MTESDMEIQRWESIERIHQNLLAKGEFKSVGSKKNKNKKTIFVHSISIKERDEAKEILERAKGMLLSLRQSTKVVVSSKE